MSNLGANFGRGKNKTVYHFIRELIQEGKYAWFVNQEGRFRIKWEDAVKLYIQYRAKKNPRYDLNIDRKKASNSFREGLLRRYCDDADGAKEYEECQKVGEKNKVVEREFQMPSKVYHSLFGSSVELPGGDQVDKKLQVSPDVGTSLDTSNTDFEEAMDVSDASVGNIKGEDTVVPSNMETPLQIFGLSTIDLDSALDENSDNDVDQAGVVQNISPSAGFVKSEKSGISVSDPELTQGNCHRKSSPIGSSDELPDDKSETSGISVSDPELTQEHQSLLQSLENLDYKVFMKPKESPLEGGYPFRVSFCPRLDTNVTSVHAVFVKSEVILGNVELVISPSVLFGHSIPGAPSSGWANVIFIDQNDTRLGSTEIFYFPDGREVVALVKIPSLFENLCEEMRCHTASSFDSDDGDPQRYGAFGNAQQVQLLHLLIDTAAREGAQQFIEMIFSTSAGRLVFDASKDSRSLPEVVARYHGHNKTACYLEGVTKGFSVEVSASKEYPKKINWSELAQAAAGEAQKCNAENESCHLMSDLSKDAGYLGDLETSSSEPHSSGSEDDISKKAKSEDEEDFRSMPSHDDGTSSGYFLDADTSSCGSFEVDCEPSDSEDCDKISPQTIKLTTPERRLADADIFSCASFEVDSERSDSGGSFTKDIKPTEKESPSLNPPVEPSSEETTQFYQAEDEEKTSFGSSRFHMFNPLNRRVRGPGSNGTHHCVLSWGTFLMCAVILPRLLAGFIVKGFLFFIGVVMGLLKKSRLVCAHFCLAVGGTLIYSTNSLRSIISGFRSSIECKRYLMVYTNCPADVGIPLVCLMIPVGSILFGFQSFTGVVEPPTECLFFCLLITVTILFSFAMELLLLDCQLSIMWERYQIVFTHCILADVGILVCSMMTVRSNLVDFQSFTGVVEPLTECLLFGLITAITLLFGVVVTPLLFDFQLSIMWERCLMVLTHTTLAVVGILVCCMMTVRSNLVDFQSFTGVVELLTVSLLFGLITAVTLLFCVAVTPLLFDFQLSIMWERCLMVFSQCILAVVGILTCFLMTVRTNLVGFQSFTGVVEPPTVTLLIGLITAVLLLFCVVVTLLLFVTAQRQERIEPKIKEVSSIFFLEEENRLFYPPEPYTSMNNFFILDRDNKEELRGKVRG